ncbi:MAG: hypothetical protein EXR76_15870 [Myxococcales bacterium]|nr:hypothetical protein [Myxococcales bacterium]
MLTFNTPIRHLISVLTLLLGTAASAQSVDVPVPPAWQSFVPWVLYDAPERNCPFLDGDFSQRRCFWPGRLELSITETGGRFEQSVELYAPNLVPLPGEPRQWPTEVLLDGKPTAIIGRGDRPYIFAPAGTHRIVGKLRWLRLPDVLRVPDDTGLLALTVNGAIVRSPHRDALGRVWLQAAPAEAQGQDTVEVAVFRRMDDAVPFLLETRLDVQVSGQGRELVIGPILPEGFVAHGFDPEVPARLGADGKLRVQVQPGRFTLAITARFEGPVAALRAPAMVLGNDGQPAAVDEVWTLSAHPDLRQIEVTGVAQVDPSQTRLPEEWRTLPAWLVRPEDTVTLVERRRGDGAPPPDRLGLERDLWLDAEGGGFTLRDALSGAVANALRLEMRAPVSLGRVSVSGQDVLITKGEGGTSAGVELREGQLDLSADSRLEGTAAGSGLKRRLPAVGWEHDFEGVGATLHLPPGWTLFDASGADDVQGTWLRRWSLLDLFLLLISVLAITRLNGRVWGALSLVALGLSFPEPDAPHSLWLWVLAGQALVHVLPEGRPAKIARVYFLGSVLVLLGVTLPFLVQQLRTAQYPVLERSYMQLGEGHGNVVGDLNESGYREDMVPLPGRPMKANREEATILSMDKPGAPAPAFEASAQDEGKAEVQQQDGLTMAKSDYSVLSRSAPQSPPLGPSKAQRLKLEVDPQAAVQTGPGLPRWSWNRHSIQWSGPVQRDQSLDLVLLSPAINLVLGVARVALLALLLLCVLGSLRRGTKASPAAPLSGTPAPSGDPPAPSSDAPAEPTTRGPSILERVRLQKWSTMLTIIALSLPTFHSAPASAEEVESPESADLALLRERLLAPPACAPHCADIESLRVVTRAGRLELELDVGALAETAIRLPGGPTSFTADHASIDGRPALLAREGETYWARVPVGRHRIRLEGSLPARGTVEVPLPQRPRHVEAQTPGYTLVGLDEHGLPQDTLQLVRSVAVDREPGAPVGAGDDPIPLPAFARVERTVTLGLQWTAETRVVRASPSGAALVLQVPLLPGESVTTANVEVKEGRAQVSLGPSANEVTWTSVLARAETLRFEAAKGQAFTEVWRVLAGPIWHTEPEGIAVVRGQNETGEVQPEWRPWPGEVLALKVRRPPPHDGRTLTIDRAQLSVTPGHRATDHELQLSLRSSRGGPFGFNLPPGAHVQKVMLDGRSQPVTADAASIDVSLAPRAQVLTVTWQSEAPLSLVTHTPTLDLGGPAVNLDVVVNVPADRWLLFAGGVKYGPAILFWSQLVMLILVAFALSRSTLTPLRMGAWLGLSIGIAQTELFSALVPVACLFALGLRARRAPAGRWLFNLQQLALVGLTLFAVGVLLASIQHGLLGLPDMQVSGNGSYGQLLRFFADRTERAIPTAYFVSVPVLVYRLLMLVWALWLASAVLQWARWGFLAFTTGGMWRGSSAPAPVPKDEG